MRIGHIIQVLEIVPDETPGLGRDPDGECSRQEATDPMVDLQVDCVGEAPGRRAAYAS